MNRYNKMIRQHLALSYALIFILVLTGCKVGGTNNNTNGGQSNVANPQGPPDSSKNKPSEQPSPTPLKEPTNILFVVDSSGSMKERVEGKSKMETAKEVLNNLIGTLSPDVQAGLLAYGHRTKKDCKDVELILPTAKIQPDLFRQKVQSLQPLGETPISYALRQAAEFLKDKTGKKTIILISDGEETCKEDPCIVAADLKKTNIDLKVHVIGFGIDKVSAKKQLNCIAEATGGTYKDAGNAPELKKTLEEVAQGSPVSNESTGDKGRLVTVSLDSNGKESNWTITIYSPGTDTQIAYTIWSTSPWEIPAGKYDVKYERSCSSAIWKRGVEIKAGQDTRIELEQLGRVHPTVRDPNGNEVSGYIEVHSNGEKLCLNMSPTDVTELAPGRYDFRFWSPQLLYGWSKEVEVKSGQETTINITASKE